MFRFMSCLVNGSGHSSSPASVEVARPLVLLLSLALLLIALPPTSARAAVVTDGDVVPADPASWRSRTLVYIGDSAVGTLTVDNGSSVDIRTGILGRKPGSEGTATVTGSGSTWEMSDNLLVGREGAGTLNSPDDGLVIEGVR